jgi:hypothetical protein
MTYRNDIRWPKNLATGTPLEDCTPTMTALIANAVCDHTAYYGILEIHYVDDPKTETHPFARVVCKSRPGGYNRANDPRYADWHKMATAISDVVVDHSWMFGTIKLFFLNTQCEAEHQNCTHPPNAVFAMTIIANRLPLPSHIQSPLCEAGMIEPITHDESCTHS